MIDISLAGLIGAIVGTIIAAALYGTLVIAIERGIAKYRARASEADSASEQEAALLRRGVLALDILIFGSLGYWIGHKIGG